MFVAFSWLTKCSVVPLALLCVQTHIYYGIDNM